MNWLSANFSLNEIKRAADNIANTAGKVRASLNEYVYGQKEEEVMEHEGDKKNFWVKAAVVIGGIALVCFVVYKIYKYFTPDYLEDYDDDFDDKFDDDFFDDEDENEDEADAKKESEEADAQKENIEEKEESTKE